MSPQLASTPLAPVNDLDAVPLLVQAGARELYMGFYDDGWFSTFGAFADVNRTSGFRFESNAYSFQQVLDAIPYIKQLGARLFITFNTASYNACQLPYIDWYFAQLAEAGADGVILSGPEFVGLALSYGLNPVASTMCGIYNTQIAGVYERLGVTRVILPRDLNLEEMRVITSAYPQLEYEVFLMRNGCIFSDSHCLGMHGMGRGALCGELRAAGKHVESPLGQAQQACERYCGRFHVYACGLCALWDFEAMGANAYKVVGRMDNPEDLAADIRLVSECTQLARSCATRDEYLLALGKTPYFEDVCAGSLNCYYPEIWDERTRLGLTS